jgi:hypothetical protein
LESDVSDRLLVYGLIEELTSVSDVALVAELSQVVARATNQLKPTELSEARALARGARKLLALGGDARTAVRAFVASATIARSELDYLTNLVENDPSPGLLQALGAEIKTLAPLDLRLAARAGIQTFRTLLNGDLEKIQGTLLEATRDNYVRMLGVLLTEEAKLGVELAFAIITQDIGAELKRRAPTPASTQPERVGFRGQEFALIVDRSSWWSGHQAENARRAMSAVASALFANDELAAFLPAAIPASFFAHLLRAAARESETDIRVRFTELLHAPALFRCVDTNVEAAAYLQSLEGALDSDQLKRIAGAIDYVDDDDIAREFALLLPEAARTERQGALCAAPDEERVPLRDRRPRISSGMGTVAGDYDDFWLRQQGVDTQAPENQRILGLVTPVSAFDTKFNNEPPSPDEAAEALPAIQALFSAVIQTGADEYVVTRAVDALAGAADAILRCDAFEVDRSAMRVIVEHAANHPAPKGGESGYAAAAWGRPAPRIEGAAAVMTYARRFGVDAQLAELIDRLSLDPIEAVRYQILVRANFLYEVDHDRMWRLLERWIDKENGALPWLVGPLSAIFRDKPQKTSALLQRLWRRDDIEKGDEVRADLAPIVGYLADFRKEPIAITLLDEMFENPTKYSAALQRIVADHREAALWLDDDTKRRVIALRHLSRVIASALRVRREAGLQDETATELASEIASQVVFSVEDAHGKVLVPEEKRARFFEEADDILQNVATFRMADFSAHMMTKLLVLWLASTPQRAIFAVASYLETVSGGHGWWSSEDLVDALSAVALERLDTDDARDAFVRAAGRMMKFAREKQPVLAAMMTRASRKA